MNQKHKNNRRKKGSFTPNQAYIDQAMINYLESGGTITRIEVTTKHFDSWVKVPAQPIDVDDFLNGET